MTVFGITGTANCSIADDVVKCELQTINVNLNLKIDIEICFRRICLSFCRPFFYYTLLIVMMVICLVDN